MLRRHLVLLMLLFAFAAAVSSSALAQDSGQVEITGRGAFGSLQDALASAVDGDVITVIGGVHPGQFVIEKSVTIAGEGWPVIDGLGLGSVISVHAPNVTIRGLHIRNSGLQLFREDAAIEVIEAPGAVIEGNRIDESLFGIYIKHSANSSVLSNDITGKHLDLPKRGDAIRVWASHDTRIEDNIVSKSRDVVLWYSERLVVTGNEITEGRYGLHFMYDDDAMVENNRLVGNAVGAYLMYSRRLDLRGNVIGANRGPSGYGIGLKDMDDAVIVGNLFADNRIGAYVDNSPRERDSYVTFTDNVFTLNDFGLRLMSSVKRNIYSGNTLMDNQEQVDASGGGSLMENQWSVDGTGNYWSDYAGYDSDGDGRGDVPYEPQKLFEKLVDQHPSLRLLTYSPASQAVDFAAEVIPFVRPQPKLIDDAPLMSPGHLPGLLLDRSTSPLPITLAALGMIVGGAAVIVFAFWGRRITGGSPGGSRRGESSPVSEPGSEPIISVKGLGKRFGSGRAVDGVSFDISPGEGVALWGSNGAGKTTILRCILGIYTFDGSVSVCGNDVRSAGKDARRYIGLVPQEIAFHDDLTVRDTIHLYARLRKVGTANCDHLLGQLQLTSHQRKQVRQLSGGLKQRLALAVALLGDPPVLLLDEPTANLDAVARAEFISLLEQLKSEGKTLVFASHRPSEVLRLADTVIWLDNGKLVSKVPPREMPQFGGQATRLRIEVGAANVESALAHLAGDGYEVSRNGTGIYVNVDPGKKAAPVLSLSDAGVPIADFDLENTGKERSDD
jgi:nitrous oxidase accessory protein